MDLCGPFLLSSAGHSYIFTAIDMFSKFVYAEPIANCDSLTVCNVIYRLFTTFGVCRTILSDQGSEFIAKSTKELCKLMNVPQEFTHSFVHHCLGACERSHRTLEERMTPYIRQGKS
jgi:transposase InsO family protein